MRPQRVSIISSRARPKSRRKLHHVDLRPLHLLVRLLGELLQQRQHVRVLGLHLGVQGIPRELVRAEVAQVLVHPVRGEGAANPVAPPRLARHLLLATIAEVFQSSRTSWSSKIIDDRHDRQQPADLRVAPGLVVEAGVLAEVHDLAVRLVACRAGARAATAWWPRWVRRRRPGLPAGSAPAATPLRACSMSRCGERVEGVRADRLVRRGAARTEGDPADLAGADHGFRELAAGFRPDRSRRRAGRRIPCAHRGFPAGPARSAALPAWNVRAVWPAIVTSHDGVRLDPHRGRGCADVP